MSGPPSQGSADSTSALSGQVCASCGRPRLTSGADECCADIGRTQTSLTMFAASPPKPYNWRLTEQEKQQAVKMYQAGDSCGTISARFGVSRQSMHGVLKLRTTMRDRIEALPRKTPTALRVKRNRSLRRYRSRAARITRAQIRAVWERDQVCQDCGGIGTDIDHILGVAKGGQTTMENLQLLCEPCHFAKTGAELRKGVA